MSKVERNKIVNFRLLSLHDKFYDYVDEQDKKASVIIRHFIKNGLEGAGGLSVEQHDELKNEICELRKSLIKIGGNLNQVAHYFNIHENIKESDLQKSHEELTNALKATTKSLNKVMNVI